MSATSLRRVTASLLVWLLLLPTELFAHVRLESSTPAKDAVLDSAPARLELRFSAHVEQRYTELTLSGPDGQTVPLGTITFVTDSDRELFADVPPLAVSGEYSVHWRTAGADGHLLEGSFTFTLALPADPTGAPPAPTADTAAALDPHGAQHEADAGHDEDAGHASDRANTLARTFHFVALTLLLGAIGFRVLLMPRLVLAGDVAQELRRRVWRTAALATLALVAAAVLRLWLQSVALHGADRAWHGPLLSMMLTGTSWGRAWVVQAALLGVFAVAVAAARPHYDRMALLIAVPAALGLATIPALTGHAAGSGALLAVINDTVHVTAAGAWVGTLAVIAIAALPTLRTRDVASGRNVADLIDRFSPLALTAAAIIVVTGVVNAVMHFDALAQVTGTTYGRALLVKLALFAGIVAAGAFNWRRQRPRLRASATAVQIRTSITLELVFALAVLTATGYLTGLPRPG